MLIFLGNLNNQNFPQPCQEYHDEMCINHSVTNGNCNGCRKAFRGNNERLFNGEKSRNLLNSDIFHIGDGAAG